MATNYQIRISVEVTDPAQLRAYALAKCLENGVTQSDFECNEHEDQEDNISYWLGWCFDAGTPPNCGFEIEDSETIFEGADL